MRLLLAYIIVSLAIVTCPCGPAMAQDAVALAPHAGEAAVAGAAECHDALDQSELETQDFNCCDGGSYDALVPEKAKVNAFFLIDVVPGGSERSLVYIASDAPLGRYLSEGRQSPRPVALKDVLLT